MLIEDGSNADVLFTHLLLNLGISKGDLKPITSPTFGIGPSELPMIRWLDLPLMLKGTLVQDKKELFGSIMMRFIVIDVHLLYNAILRKQTQGNLDVHPDMKYLMVTFGTKEGDAEIFIDQAEVRKIFMKARQSSAKVHLQTLK